MRAAQARWVEGKVVSKFLVETFDDGRGGVAHAVGIVFTDGSRLGFSVEETARLEML